MVAVALGALLGVVLTLTSERAASFVTPSDPFRGMVVVAAMMGLRLFVTLCVLAAYFVFARASLAPFGLALALSFIAGLAFEAVKVSRLDARHTSA